MVIVFATVVFTGSMIKGARDRVGDLFPKSIKTNQGSSENATSADPQEPVKTTPYERKLPHHFPDHHKISTTPRTRCFQSYSSNDFFSSPEEILTVKNEGNMNKEIIKSKQVGRETTTTAQANQDHAMNETSRIREEGPKLSATEENEPVRMSIKNDEKPKCVSFQTHASPRSQIRHRRERPKTLKKELEEAGLVIDAGGQPRVPTEPREESSTPQQCDEVDKEGQFESLSHDEPGNSGNLQSSVDDSSITEDTNTGCKHKEADGSNDATNNCPAEEVSTAEDAIVSKPVMMNGNLDEEKSHPFKKQSKGDAKKMGNMNILPAFEKGGAYENTNTDSHITEDYETKISQKPICYYGPPVYAGDTVQNKNKNQNHESQDIISETGDFGKPTEIIHVEVSATNVNLGDMTRVKHRSQKSVEDNTLMHRDTHRKNGAIPLKGSTKVDATKVTEGNCQPSTENSKNEPQSSGVEHIQVVRANINGTGKVLNDTSSAIPISNNRSRKPQFLKTPLRSSLYDDALDQVVARFDDGLVELDTTQDSVELSEESRRPDEDKISGESDNSMPIDRSPESVPDTPRDCIPSTVPFICSHKPVVSHREYDCSDASMPLPQGKVKKELHRFLEDFSAFDRVRAHWSRDFALANYTRPCQNGDVIVMAVENRDQQRRRMDRRQIRERIAKATDNLAAITKETKSAEGRLLMLVQDVGNAGSRSDMSEEALHEENNLYRECLLNCYKMEEDFKAVDSRYRAVDVEFQAMKRRDWKTVIMHRAAQGEIKLLDHRIVKEQTLQEEQRHKRLRNKRRRFQRTSLKVNTLLALIVLQVIIVIIIALWRL